MQTQLAISCEKTGNGVELELKCKVINAADTIAICD